MQKLFSYASPQAVARGTSLSYGSSEGSSRGRSDGSFRGRQQSSDTKIRRNERTFASVTRSALPTIGCPNRLRRPASPTSPAVYVHFQSRKTSLIPTGMLQSGLKRVEWGLEIVLSIHPSIYRSYDRSIVSGSSTDDPGPSVARDRKTGTNDAARG